jgi:hypothetical protein
MKQRTDQMAKLANPEVPKVPFYVHHSITNARIEEAVLRYNSSLDNPGFCLECGEEADGCEPDARDYKCEHCGANRVYGACEVFMCVVI